MGVITEITIQFAPAGCSNALKFQSTLNKNLIPHLQFVSLPYIPEEETEPPSALNGKCEGEICISPRIRLRSGIGIVTPGVTPGHSSFLSRAKLHSVLRHHPPLAAAASLSLTLSRLLSTFFAAALSSPPLPPLALLPR